MIVGIGSDLCDIRRVEEILQRFGDRFIRRCFTAIERKKSDGRAGRAASYAKRFAAKEACAKALGTGIRRGVFWHDMGVSICQVASRRCSSPAGRPSVWPRSRRPDMRQ